MIYYWNWLTHNKFAMSFLSLIHFNETHIYTFIAIVLAEDRFLKKFAYSTLRCPNITNNYFMST